MTDLAEVNLDESVPPPTPLEIQKERAMKCKLISLDELGHHPLTDPVSFSKRDKAKLLKMMEEWFAKTDDEIQEEFNSIVRDKLFDENNNPSNDYTTFPIKDNAITYADHPEWKEPVNMNHTIPQLDIGGNEVEIA